MRAPVTLLSLLLVLPLHACSGGDNGASGPPDAEWPPTDCNDGEDDDGDDLVDTEDPGCDGPLDDSELDNPIPACGDGEDNDGDGRVDFPNDPGCHNPQQNRETDDCPDGPGCPRCSNAADDDGDGEVDYPNDPGCLSAADNTEISVDPTACVGFTPMPVENGSVVSGQIVQGNSMLDSSCGGAGVEHVYELFVADPQVLVATTDLTSTAVNTVVYVRERCGEPASEHACNDNAPGAQMGSTIVTPLEPGYYYIIVDGQSLAATGPFSLSVNLYPGIGSACDTSIEDPCAPGLVCRTLEGATMPTCELPVCSDERDDDGDGVIDFPADPGCASTTDTTEDDDCPSGEDCPACANDLDDDGDGQTDYPADDDCASASQSVEGCGAESDPIDTVSLPLHTGTTTGLTHDFTPSCNTSNTAPDKVWILDVPVQLDTMSVDLTGSSFDTVTAIKGGSCSGDDLQCADPLVLDRTDVAPGTYSIIIDGWASGTGMYQLKVRGQAAAGEACTDPLFGAGVLSCPDYAPCDGSICVPPACGDGDDDDGAGDGNGYPEDPGCVDATDTTEEDDCPDGANCPACANGLDDDGDGESDYPDDAECASASQLAESCAAESDPFGQITGGQTMGSNAGSTNDFSPPSGCSFGSGGGEVVYFLDLPVDMNSLRLHTIGSNLDTVLYVDDPSCDGTVEPWCDDDSGGSGFTSDLTITDIEAGTWAVFIDSYGSGSVGPFTVTMSGVAAAGAACTDPLFTQGTFTCPTYAPCNGSICEPPACDDGVDNDGDGEADFPADPGCQTDVDDDEADGCPGSGCPACANDSDDDGDGATDYPQDVNCLSASDTTEGCEADATVPIAVPITTGTTTGSADDFELACGANTGADRTFLLSLPTTVSSLTISTAGSAFDTLLALKTPACTATDLFCNNNDGTFNTSRLALSNVAPGNYVITVDGNNNAAGNFALSVQGIVGAGAACNSPLFGAGVLACPAGQSCNGSVCQ